MIQDGIADMFIKASLNVISLKLHKVGYLLDIRRCCYYFWNIIMNLIAPNLYGRNYRNVEPALSSVVRVTDKLMVWRAISAVWTRPAVPAV